MSDEISFDGVRYSSLAEAAEHASISSDYITRLCRSNKVGGKLIDNRWYVDTASLDQFLKASIAFKEKRAAQLSEELRTVAARAAADQATQTANALLASRVARAKNISLALAASAAIVVFAFGATAEASGHPRAFTAAALQNISTFGSHVVALASGITNARYGAQSASPTNAIAAVQNSNSLVSTTSVAVVPPTVQSSGNYSQQKGNASNPPTKTIIQQIVEKQPFNDAAYVTQDELTASLSGMNASFHQFIAANSFSADASPPIGGGPTNTIAAASAIDQLSGTALNNVSVNGISGITPSDLPDLSGTYLSLAGGTLTGQLTSSSTATSTLAAGVNILAGCFSVNGVCVSGGGGGGATIGGADTEVQFNSAGSFDGSSGFTFASSTQLLTVTNASTTNFSATNGSTTDATSTNLFASLGNITAGIINSLSGNSLTYTAASTTNLVLSGSPSGFLQTNAQGVVSATSTFSAGSIFGVLGLGQGGTGTTSAPSYGQLLIGNGIGGYNLISTSSLGIIGGGNSTVSTSSQNIWSALQIFSGSASSTNFSNFGTAYFGGSATSTFNSAGLLTLANISNSLLGVNSSGQVVATTSIGTNLLTGTLGIGNGGTGVASTPGYGQVLTGNSSSGYTLTATSSLGFSNTVFLTPSNNLQTAINNNPPGTIFQLSAGTWNNQAIVPQYGDEFIGDPDGGTILSGGNTTTALYSSNGTVPLDILFENITVEYYNVSTSECYLGAVHGTDDWTFINDTFTLNNCTGLNIGSNSRVVGGHYTYNAHAGIEDGGSTNMIIEGAEIAYNNTRGDSVYNDAAGIKMGAAASTTIADNWVHDNYAVGIWFDVGSANIVIDNNTVDNNVNSGIDYEISSYGTITNNVVSNNSGSEIGLNNSASSTVTGNNVRVSSPTTFGILVQSTNRGDTTLVTENDTVTNNVITYATTSTAFDGGGGLRNYGNTVSTSTISFENNVYYVPATSSAEWYWGDYNMSWAQYQLTGEDSLSKVILDKDGSIAGCQNVNCTSSGAGSVQGGDPENIFAGNVYNGGAYDGNPSLSITTTDPWGPAVALDASQGAGGDDWILESGGTNVDGSGIPGAFTIFNGTHLSNDFSIFDTGNAEFTGDLGIGTTSPTDKLDVVGNAGSGAPITAAVTNTNSGGYAQLQLNNDDGAYSGLDVLGSAFGTGDYAGLNNSTVLFSQNNLYISANEDVNHGGSGDIIFTNGGYDPVNTEHARLTAAGNFGINNSSPSYKLDVGGFINTDQYSGYKQAGNTILYASSTIGSVLVGPGQPTLVTTNANAGNTSLGYFALHDATSSVQNTAVGWVALQNDTSGTGNSALGWGALGGNTTGSDNVGIGIQALQANTTGGGDIAIGEQTLWVATSTSGDVAIGGNTLQNDASTGSNTGVGSSVLFDNTYGNTNTGIGYGALNVNTIGSENTAVGYSALSLSTTGGENVALGKWALGWNTSATSDVAVGYEAGNGAFANYSNQGGTYLGYIAGANAQTNSNYNTLVGYAAGTAITTGSGNIFLGANTASNNTLTSGSQNISIGYDISLASSTGSDQLDIGNLIYGTALTGTNTTIAGNIGVGTSTPYSRLEAWGTASTGSTSAFLVVNSASTSEFNVLDNGNAVLAGSLTQSSDQRLKTNIRSLDASSSLAAINSLDPVTFNWIDPDRGTVPQLGFIAQQVQPIFPNLISTTSATALTPDGTLSLNYIDLISPIVSAIQELSAELTSIENTIAGFAASFTTQTLTFTNANGQQLCLQTSAGTPVCVTGDQLAAVLAGSGQSSSGSGDGGSSPSDDASDTPPVIAINGDNPAFIQLGSTYDDLGATITGPQNDLNLDIATYVNGIETNPVQIDTNAAATDTIDYVVTDQSGLTSTSTRTVIVEAAETPTTDGTSTDATSSAQD